MIFSNHHQTYSSPYSSIGMRYYFGETPEETEDARKREQEEKNQKAASQKKSHKRKVIHTPAKKDVPNHLLKMFGK